MQKIIHICDRCGEDCSESAADRLVRVSIMLIRDDEAAGKKIFHWSAELCPDCRSNLEARFQELPVCSEPKQNEPAGQEEPATPADPPNREPTFDEDTPEGLTARERQEAEQYADVRQKIRQAFRDQNEQPVEIADFIARATKIDGLPQCLIAAACGIHGPDLSVCKTKNQVYPFIKRAIQQHFGVCVYGKNDQAEG